MQLESGNKDGPGMPSRTHIAAGGEGPGGSKGPATLRQQPSNGNEDVLAFARTL